MIIALSTVMRTFKLITRFYSGLFLANFLTTLSCVGLISAYGSKAFEIIGVLFWFKIISLVVIFFTAIYYKTRELYYYQNLGISKLKLALTTSAFDFGLWAILLVIALKAI